MSITMEQILNHVRRDEPDYVQAASLRPDALPQLGTLLQ
jgi:hypothetical protein